MNNLIVQPCSTRKARENFKNTIDSIINLSDIKSFLSNDECSLLEKCPNELRIWGVRPRNYPKWNQFEYGDIVLFCRDKLFFRRAIVQHKIHSKKLAKHLWGVDEYGETWEYIYTIAEYSPIKLSYYDFKSKAITKEGIPFKPNFQVGRGLMILSYYQWKELNIHLQINPNENSKDIQDELLVELFEAKTEFDKSPNQFTAKRLSDIKSKLREEYHLTNNQLDNLITNQ